jgi:hypothetical protein
VVVVVVVVVVGVTVYLVQGIIIIIIIIIYLFPPINPSSHGVAHSLFTIRHYLSVCNIYKPLILLNHLY